jgi:hypothetical protein
MKKLIAFALVFLGTVAATGCGGWSQDPMSGKDGKLKDGWPFPTKPVGTKPVNPEMIQITAPYFVSYEEEKERKFEILVRVLEADYTADLEIENLSEFPGATYDVNDNMFSWRPDKGYVESMGVGVSVLKILKIKVNAYKAGSVVYSGDQQVEIRVFRDYTAPEITRVDMPRQVMREGERMDLTVYYADKDADPNDRSTWATLRFESLPATKSLAGLVSYSRTNKGVGATEYVTTARIDLSEGDLSSNLDVYSMGMTMISRYGKTSGSQRLDLTVLTSFAAPISTWTEKIEATVDTPMTYKFDIFDPKMEQNLSSDSFVGLPQGADIQCQKTGNSVLNCVLRWTPVAGSEGDHTIEAVVNGRNTDTRDTLVVQKRIYLRTHVQPKGP